jgi:hypothetical protein
MKIKSSKLRIPQVDLAYRAAGETRRLLRSGAFEKRNTTQEAPNQLNGGGPTQILQQIMQLFQMLFASMQGQSGQSGQNTGLTGQGLSMANMQSQLQQGLTQGNTPQRIIQTGDA